LNKAYRSKRGKDFAVDTALQSQSWKTWYWKWICRQRIAIWIFKI